MNITKPRQPVNNLTISITELKNRLYFRLLGKMLFLCSAVALSITGIVILSYRFWGSSPEFNRFLLILLIFLCTLLPALFLSRRKMVEGYDLVKLIDCHNSCGGKAITAFELNQPLPEFNQLKVPEVSWRWGQSLQLIAAAVCFAIGTALVPLPQSATHHTPINLSGEKQLLEEKIDSLEEVEAITQEEAEVFIEQLEEIVENQAKDAAEIWEAIDNLNEALIQEAQDAAQSAVWKYEKISYMALAAEEIEQLMQQGSLGSEDPAVKELKDMLKKFLDENGDKLGNAGKEMQQMLANSGTGMTMQELSDMIKSMNFSKEETEKLMKKLAQASGSGNNSTQQNMQQMKKLTKEDLKKFLDNEGKCQNGDCSALLMACQSGLGSPGVSQGPGHAPINYGKPVDETGGKFKPMQLPEGAITSLDDSELQGVSIAAPKLTTEKQTFQNQLNNVKSDGGNAIRFRPLPRHKKAVENYFKH